jgi:hypothetical protein
MGLMHAIERVRRFIEATIAELFSVLPNSLRRVHIELERGRWGRCP